MACKVNELGGVKVQKFKLGHLWPGMSDRAKNFRIRLFEPPKTIKNSDRSDIHMVTVWSAKISIPMFSDFMDKHADPIIWE